MVPSLSNKMIVPTSNPIVFSCNSQKMSHLGLTLPRNIIQPKANLQYLVTSSLRRYCKYFSPIAFCIVIYYTGWHLGSTIPYDITQPESIFYRTLQCLVAASLRHSSYIIQLHGILFYNLLYLVTTNFKKSSFYHPLHGLSIITYHTWWHLTAKQSL